jgi:hypothetical protein
VNVGRRLGSVIKRVYGRSSRKADYCITAVFLAARLALVILAVRSATDRWFHLSLGSWASVVVGLRLWHLPYRPTFVEEAGLPGAGQSHVEVCEGETVDRRALSALGGRRGFFTPWLWTFVAPDERALADLFTRLRDAGVHFRSEDGRGWGPAEVFEELRKNGLVSGTYRKEDEF